VEAMALRLEEVQDDLDELDPPEELEVGQLSAAGRAALDASTDDPEILFGGENPWAESDALATEIGLTACATDG
jgi:hypothetical protein